MTSLTERIATLTADYPLVCAILHKDTQARPYNANLKTDSTLIYRAGPVDPHQPTGLDSPNPSRNSSLADPGSPFVKPNRNKAYTSSLPFRSFVPCATPLKPQKSLFGVGARFLITTLARYHHTCLGLFKMLCRFRSRYPRRGNSVARTPNTSLNRFTISLLTPDQWPCGLTSWKR